MNEQKVMTPGAAGASCKSRACCPLQTRWGLLLWAILLAAVAYAQWPMLKGMFYKATGAEAPASAVQWRGEFDAALAESTTTGKPVLMDFSASWCPPCEVMQHDVWPDREVAAAVNDRYVPLLVDVDDAKNAQLAQRYGVRGIPTILVLDAEGQVVRAGSFMSKGDMLKFLNGNA